MAAACHSSRKAAASVLHLMAVAGLLLSACTDASPNPSGAASAAGADLPPDTAVSSGSAGTASDGTAVPTALPEPARPSDCNAPKAERFIGRKADPATRAELADAVAPISTIRWVGPGDATTEDYSTSRLNVMLDVGTVIRSAHCG